MFAYRSALAEWRVVRARVVRTRLGLWLLTLAVAALALPGTTEADGLAPLFGSHPLVTMGSALLWVLPGTWRAAPLAAGEPSAWLHALAWAVGGTALAASRLRRRLQ